MKFIDFILAIPFGIANIPLCIGMLFLLAYIYYKITDSNKYLIKLNYNLNYHYIIIIAGSFGIGYGVAIYFIYKTFF